MESRARHFNVRAFAALVMTASGIGLPLTGYMNHVYGLEAMSVARHAWMSAHNLLGVLFTVSAVCHAWMNRRALLGHVRGARARLGAVNREAISAAALVLAGLALFVGHAFHAGGLQMSAIRFGRRTAGYFERVLRAADAACGGRSASRSWALGWASTRATT